jgi:hypothetical protein
VVPAELFQALIAKPGTFLIPGHSTYGQWTDNSLFPWLTAIAPNASREPS